MSGKTHTTLSVDYDTLEKARTLNINISGEFNSYLQTRIHTAERDINSFDIKLLNLKRDKITRKLAEEQAELKIIDDQIQSYEERKRIDEEERIKKEREIIEKQKMCSICSSYLLEGKFRMVKEHPICLGCFSDRSKAHKINELTTEV